MKKNTPKPPDNKKEELIAAWESDFYEAVRRVSSWLMVIVPLLILGFTRFVLLSIPDLHITLQPVYWACSIACLSGICSLFIPWYRFSHNWYFIIAFIAAACLIVTVRATGFNRSPFHDIFYLAAILSTFYFRGFPLLAALFVMGTGYLFSGSADYYTFIVHRDFGMIFLIFAIVLYITLLFHRRMRKYQLIACDAYEELLQQKEAIHKSRQLEAIMATIGGISHKLSQPLTAALNQVELALLEKRTSLTREELEKLLAQLIVAKDLMRQFGQTGELAMQQYVGGSKILAPAEKAPAPPEEEQSSGGEPAKGHAA